MWLNNNLTKHDVLAFGYQAQAKGNVGELLPNKGVVEQVGGGREETAVYDTLVTHRRYFPLIGKSP